MVAPSRVRGLKRDLRHLRPSRQGRRTLTGAWIEARTLFGTRITKSVAPSRVRGLKLGDLRQSGPEQGVAPSRVRGLKYRAARGFLADWKVAPSRVWIEGR